MTLETSFEKFDVFADAPDAVAKMRELVLELSATGRLIPDALERPVGEDTKLMGTVVELVMGQAPAGDEYNTQGRGTVFVKVGEFGPLYPREEVWTTNPLKFAKTGDVLVCVVGATVGKLNLAIDCAIGRSAAAIRPSSALETKFLYYSLIPYTLRLRRNSRGSAQGVIGKAELNAMSLWVPSRAVQKRIVAKVDGLMALCDRLEAQQQERESRERGIARASLSRFADAPTPANLNFIFHESYAIEPADLRKCILTLAVQGKLVPQDPSDEPAEDMLAIIEAEKKRLAGKGELKADKRAWVNSSPNPPHDIPESWCWVRLQDVFEISRGGSPRPAGDPRFFGGPIPWITVGEVTKDTGKYLTQTAAGLTEEGAERSRFINPGDLLLTNSGATLGVPKISSIRGCMNDGVAVLRLFHSFGLNDFGYLYLTHQTPAFRSVNQGMGQPNLNTPIIAGWFFPLPPLAEQRRIVAKVEQLMALVDALETQLAASRAAAANLLSALVAELTAARRSANGAASFQPGAKRPRSKAEITTRAERPIYHAAHRTIKPTSM